MSQKCPGQDSRFWRPGDIYTIVCPYCGAGVEFFKDDRSRRCTSCGVRFKNPRLDLGCAKWCAYARECVDYRGDEDEEAAGAEPDAQ